MPLTLYTWASRHGIARDAIEELRILLIGADQTPALPADTKPGSEAAVQNMVRLEAARRGYKLFRNNVGVLKDDRGVPVRFGLANDSSALNRNYKSSDLIGILPLTITPAHIGHVVGQFCAIECKHADWQYKGTDREQAQSRWIQMVVAMGGHASFSTGGL